MSIEKNNTNTYLNTNLITDNDYDPVERYMNTTRTGLSKGKDSRSRDLAQIFDFIVQQAQKFCRNKQDLTDYVQSAIVQIMAVYEKFDARRQCKFCTFAGPWIRKGFQKMLRKSIMVPLSVHDMERRTSIYIHSLAFELENHRKPSLEELMTLIKAGKNKNLKDLSLRKLKFLIGYTTDTVSIDTPLGDAPDSPTLADLFVAPPTFPKK